jgi:uncharacterized protein with HEPN domain
VTEPEARDPAYAGHMLEAIARIRRYVGRKGRTAFLASPLLQDAVIRNIEIIGEAAGRVSRAFAARHAAIPWRDIAGMRHRLIHGYLTVNPDTVWQVVKRDLPALEKDLRAIAASKTVAPVVAPRKRVRAGGKRRLRE